MQEPSLFDAVQPHISLEDVFEAYFDCRRHKRGTVNALRFEINFEDELVRLWREINDGSYEIGRSIAFVVNKPVKREIFAADFRDRIVHHLVINKLMPFFERAFIPASYSCRAGKGSLYGLKDIEAQIRRLSHNWTRPCFFLKMDISAFFMSIRKELLFRLLERFIKERYSGIDQPLLIDLVRKIVFNMPQNNCLIKGHTSDWKGLSFSKSLFRVPAAQGLPIGNLTSQIFANFYLNAFDHFIVTHPAGFGYGRYVDDFVLVHPDRAALLAVHKEITAFLRQELSLTAHPGKMTLQHVAKGLPFVGFYVKPGRLACGRRIKNHVFQKIHFYNLSAGFEKSRLSCADVCAGVNSYLGVLKHAACFRLRRRILDKLAFFWKKQVFVGAQSLKMLPLRFANPIGRMQQDVRKNIF